VGEHCPAGTIRGLKDRSGISHNTELREQQELRVPNWRQRFCRADSVT
jgi:hypothetical protein